MAGLPSALNGRIVHSINFQPCVEAYRFNAAHAAPLNFKAGFAGPIGQSVGQAPWVIRLTFAGTEEKQQFNLIALQQQQSSGGLGFSYDFWEGGVGVSNRWLVTNCFMGEFTMDNDPQAGNTDKQVTIQGSTIKKIG